VRLVVGVGLLVGTLLGTACRFERRPDLGARQAGDTTLFFRSGGASDPVQDSVRAVITALDEAFRVGDITRVAQLTTRDVVLIDQEDEVYWTRADAARLPRALRGEDKLGWEPTGTTVAALADGSELATLRFQASVSGESVPWTAVESWLLVRTEQGWRLRYLHRSRGLGRTAPRP
jgi:ketosteroid isomerase-like protein